MMGHTEKIWLTLIGLTFAGAWLAESGHAGWPLTLVVVFLIGFKSFIVIDHYMEMRLANRRLWFTLYIFVCLILIQVVASHGWGEMLSKLITIH